MARGMIGKAMRGLAATTPFLLEQHRANIQAKRDEKLNQYRNIDVKQQQDFRTAEREASQEFQASENEKNRQLNLYKAGATSSGKVPEYEKILRRMSAETFNSSLGDSFNFEGDNADKAATLAQRSVQIYKGMENPDTTVAYKQALDELRTQESLPSQEDIRSQVESEASDKAGYLRSDKKDFGMPREDWINQETQKRFQESRSGGLVTNAMDSGSSSASYSSSGGPVNNNSQFVEGKIYRDAQGNRARYQNGQWIPLQ